MSEQRADCLIIGGGPAGLTAAIYLARFHLRVIVVDHGRSRAALIPMTRNHAGFPGGISGRDLLDRMRQQALDYGARIARAEVDRLLPADGGFLAEAGDARYQAANVLLATGVTNNRPPISKEDHDLALRRGLLRYCPICDGYEATDQNIAVIGTGERGTKEAMFLRGYSRRVTLIAPEGPHELGPTQAEQLRDAAVALIAGPASGVTITEDAITVATPDGTLSFDTLYPALGSVIRSELARGLGAEMSEDGCLVVDDHQRTSVPGLFAAGDVVLGLDQISHAMGEGGVAATTIRNDLAAGGRLYR
jgi:thioredoxin reductase (NADPH)